MAGHWIPWECGLTRKREVMMIAKALKLTRREAAAACMEVWEWASEQSLDGLIAGCGLHDVSEAVGVPGLGEAMRQVGWLVNGDGNVQFPHWERFNGKSAKARMMNVYRVRRHRQSAADGRRVG